MISSGSCSGGGAGRLEEDGGSRGVAIVAAVVPDATSYERRATSFVFSTTKGRPRAGRQAQDA